MPYYLTINALLCFIFGTENALSNVKINSSSLEFSVNSFAWVMKFCVIFFFSFSRPSSSLPPLSLLNRMLLLRLQCQQLRSASCVSLLVWESYRTERKCVFVRRQGTVCLCTFVRESKRRERERLWNVVMSPSKSYTKARRTHKYSLSLLVKSVVERPHPAVSTFSFTQALFLSFSNFVSVCHHI